jgi:Spy/CpxP family protein refolding chaperone
MSRRILLVLGLLLAAAPAAAQRPGAGRAMERRLQLEEQVLTRFVERAGQELGLDAGRREQLRTHVRASAAERRQLHRASLELRRRMLQSLNTQADDAEFERLLRELRELQDREQTLADRELEQLGAFLTPRQRAHYLLLMQRGRGALAPGV